MFLFFCSLFFMNTKQKLQAGLKPTSKEVDAWNWLLISSRPLCLVLALLLTRQVSGHEHSWTRWINTYPNAIDLYMVASSQQAGMEIRISSCLSEQLEVATGE